MNSAGGAVAVQEKNFQDCHRQWHIFRPLKFLRSRKGTKNWKRKARKSSLGNVRGSDV